jgi:hypothetical protein
MKSLEKKLTKIKLGQYRPTDFIIADAKDADMGGGVGAPGPNSEKKGTFKSYPDYLQAMREMTKSGLVDIMLMSASSAEILEKEGLFANSPVTPATRWNDTTDIWGPRGSTYKSFPSQNFRTALLNRVQEYTNLGLYSITFSNNLEKDIASLQGLKEFQMEAAANNIRYFLEVFNPQIDTGINPKTLPFYINDCIVRCLAGTVNADRPLFLKMQYNGPQAMEELAAYDPERLIVGILGGAKGTTRDTFELIRQGEKYGARVALFGRKINLTEAPLKLVELMRTVVQKELDSKEAVIVYHDFLKSERIQPNLDLEEDIKITESVLNNALQK